MSSYLTASLPGHGVTGLPAPREGEELGIRDHEIKQLFRFATTLGEATKMHPVQRGKPRKKLPCELASVSSICANV